MVRHDVDPAIPYGEDPTAYAEVLRSIHGAVVRGERPPARPRPVIARSWERMRRLGVSPYQGTPRVDPVQQEDARLLDYSDPSLDLDQLRRRLGVQLERTLWGSGIVGIFSDPSAKVRVRYGTPAALATADSLNFVRGAVWAEDQVGTNAIGTAAHLNAPVHTHGPEHWCVGHHGWSCAAAPVADPRTGHVFGVLDLSGPVAHAHASLLPLVVSLAAQGEYAIRENHRSHLERLRSREWELTQRIPGPWALLDRWGWPAAVHRVPLEGRIRTAAPLAPGVQVLEGLGAAEVSRAGQGFLVRPLGPEQTRVEYALDRERAELVVSVEGVPTAHALAGRHLAILALLAQAPAPLSAREIAEQVWDPVPQNLSTARAEISRLRKRFPELVSEAPYHLVRPLSVV